MKERGKLNILLVDDNSKNLVSLEALLENPDYNFIKAMSGKEALSHMLEHDFALVLLDVQMPEMNGFETAELIRGSEKTKYIPIIFVTAISKDQKHIFKGYESGAVDYLFKPLDPDILKSKVNVFLELHKQKNSLENNRNILKQTVEELAKVNKELEHEITIRKQAEEEARKAKDFLTNAIENSLDPIIISDNKGCIVRANKSFLKMIGAREQELIGSHMAEFSPTEEGIYESTTGEPIQIGKEFFDDHTTLVARLVEGESITAFENYIIRNDRKIVPVEENIALLYNEKGERIGAMGVIRDITERRKAAKKIKEGEEFLENVIKSSRDGIVISDEREQIILINTAMEKMSGYRREELVGEHPFIILPGDGEMSAAAMGKKTGLYENGFAFYESKLKTKGGELKNVECSFSMINDNTGENIGYVSIARDITERKELQYKLLQSEKLKSLGELAGGVAHDFNNVLAAILGRAQLLKMIFEHPLGKEERRKSMIELKKGLEIIEQASRDGAETVRRIQEFARRRDDDKHFSTVNLNEIIDNALEFTRVKWKDEAESKGIKINIQKDLSILPATSGSAAELREVVTNLINNAVDAMPQGGEIRIKTYVKDSQIVVNVEDTGSGIPGVYRDKIFDPFFTTKGVQSTGLGMSVSYGIIQRHRGTIEVDSSEGQGTTFTIKIPVSVTAEEKELKPISGKIKKARILVVEDEDEVRNLLSAILKKGGHEVEPATSGDQGIEIFEKNEFDLVFTDLGMPGISGWQVAEKVKEINCRVPVVLITGWDIKQEESVIKDSYVDLIIHKPFEMDKVLNVVQEGMMLIERFKAV
jgi:PAS domain S-box-containing protein